MNSKFLAALGIAGALMTAAPAQAHFMMAYTPETALEKAQDLDMRFVFTHPAEAGHMMNMGGVKEFYALYQRGDAPAKKIDLKGSLKEITWKNPESSAPAYAALISRKDVRSMGDYMFVFVPGYYYEKEEDPSRRTPSSGYRPSTSRKAARSASRCERAAGNACGPLWCHRVRERPSTSTEWPEPPSKRMVKSPWGRCSTTSLLESSRASRNTVPSSSRTTMRMPVAEEPSE